ncbi:MAG: RagB/SusD family nutrient uptake outer membrane protein [Rikenellaceae bacterium]
MKNLKIYKYNLLVLLAGMLAFSSCESTLDQEPLDQLTEAIYYKTPEQFEAAANYLYEYFGFEYGDTDASDLTNNYGETEPYGWGTTSLVETDTDWSNPYIRLRRANIVIEKAFEYEADGNAMSDIYQSLGTGYFFRAWCHWKLLKVFGGVPVVTTVVDVADDVLWGPRNSRYEVISQIIADLDEIIDNEMLPTTAALPDSDIGKVTMEAAKAFKARICLYAGTWDKYVGTATDGDGVTSGAGSAKPSDYPSQSEFFTMASTLAKEVFSTGSFELWDKSDETVNPSYAYRHQFYLFCLEDELSNPWGYTKSDNKEFILQTIYDYTYRQINSNLSHAHGCSPSRKLVDMYLCEDGLPIHLSPNFDLENAFKSKAGEFVDRDERLYAFVKEPGVKYWDNGPSWGTDYTEDQSSDNPYFLEFGYSEGLNATRLAAKRMFGYTGDKFTTEHIDRADTDEAYNYPLFRLAEMYLVYAEALCELNGTVTDAQLDESINLLRARSNVAPLSAALIAPYADLTMLGEVRRERAIELFGENFRFDDLKRWGIAEDELNQNVHSVYFKYGEDQAWTDWQDQFDDYEEGVTDVDPSYAYDTAYLPGGILDADEIYSSYAGFTPAYAGASVIVPKSYHNFSIKHYLDPLPEAQIRLNPNLLQNPIWW